MAKAAPEVFVGETPNMAPSMAAHSAMTQQMNNTQLQINKRSLFLDELSFEQQFLQCGVCKERFHSSWLPRMLPCHHSFCQSCIEQIYKYATENRTNQSSTRSYLTSLRPLSGAGIPVTCPACNKPFMATDDLIANLPADHRVVQLMDFVHNTDRQTVTLCSAHSSRPLNFFCETCIRPVCRECTIQSHREEEGHVVLDLEQALAKFTPMVDTEITDMEVEGEGIQEKKNKLDSVTLTLDGLKLDLLGQVKDVMSRMRSMVDERQKILEDKVHEQIETEKAKLMEKSKMLEERRQFLNSRGKRLKVAREENNVEEMFNLHQEVREKKEKTPLRIREIDNGLMTSFMLNTRDEGLLASRIKNFGDVTGRVDTTSPRNRVAAQTYSNLYRSSSFR